MDFWKIKQELVQVSAECGWNEISTDWHGVDIVWPLLEKIRQEGSVFILKVDGERIGQHANGPFTTAITGGPLQEEGIRIDCHRLEDALAYSIVEFARKVWGFKSS